MALCSEEGDRKQGQSGNPHDIANKETFQHLNPSAEDGSELSSECFEATQGLHGRSLPIDHKTSSVKGGCEYEQYQKIPLAQTPKKRGSDPASMEETNPKRYCGPNALNIMGISGPDIENDELEFFSDEANLGNAYEGRSSHEAVQLRENASINTASSPTPRNRTSQAPNTIMQQLGSPIWYNCDNDELEQPKGWSTANDKDLYQSYQPRYGNAAVYTSTHQMAVNKDLQWKLDPNEKHDMHANKAKYNVPTSQNSVARSVMDTTHLIMSQIPKTTSSLSETVDHKIPIEQSAPAVNATDHVCIHGDYTSSKHESTRQISQPQPDSPNSETLAADSDESDDTPMELMLNRMRYVHSDSHSNFRRSPRRTPHNLPRKGITFTKRSDTKYDVLHTCPTNSFTGGGPASPICLDSPPQSQAIKKSLPMKDRLSSSKSALKDRSLQERQLRAAEKILKKEQDVTDKELFGEIIEFSHNTEPLYDGANQKQESKEVARLMKAEYKRDQEREAKRLDEEIAEKARARKEKEEEIKKARRNIERKKQLGIDEAQKEERRRMAEEQIEASRMKELADKEERIRNNQKEILAITEAAKRKEMELKREIARLQAASLRSATAIPKQRKKHTNSTVNEAEEEELLFVPDARSDSDEGHETSHSLSKRDIDGPSRLGSFKANRRPEVGTKTSGFRSRYQEEREAFEAQINAEAEKKKIENLKARFAARRESTTDKTSAHLSGVLDDSDDDAMETDRSAHKLKAKSFGSKHNIFTKCQPFAPADDNQKHSTRVHQMSKLTANNNAATIPLRKKYSSEIKLASAVEQQEIQQQTARRSRTERRKEERRKKDGEKARDKQRQRLIEDAAAGGYTITDDEIDKRLEAYMKKREEKIQKRQNLKGHSQSSAFNESSQNSTFSEQMIYRETQPQSATDHLTSKFASHLATHDQEEFEKGDPVLSPEQQSREKNEIIMREAMSAIAKNSHRGTCFANTAAKRTVDAFKSLPEQSEESEESEEDPDDDPIIERTVTASGDQKNGIPGKIREDEILNGQTSDEDRITVSFTTPSAEPKEPNNSSGTKIEDLVLDIAGNATSGIIQGDLPTKEASKADNRLVRVYTVKSIHIIDGEEQPPEDLKGFLSLSDANEFAADKIKEYQSVDDMPSSQEHSDQLFTGQIVHDDKNTTQIWVASQIISAAKISDFDPMILGDRFPSSSWFIRFETVKEVFNEDSKTSSLCKVSEIIPNQHYSDVELANHAACEYFIKFMKPPRPVLDHVKQYENELNPQVRSARDERCNERTPFQCAIEKRQGHAEWLVEKEVTIEVVQYQMQGPLN